MTIETPRLCRNGHDLGVFGVYGDGRCVACSRAKRLRYYHANVATFKGQISRAKAEARSRIRHNEARVTELERQLQYAGS